MSGPSRLRGSFVFFMKNGRWSAIRDGVVDKIPSNRPASIGDFVLIVTQIYKRETPISILALSKRLCWSRNKTRAYLKKVGLEVYYPGERKDPSGGILKATLKENLDPGTKDIWIVTNPRKPK